MRSPYRHMINRDGFWVYSRRVPVAYKHWDPRGIVTETTGVRVEDDRRGSRAARVVDRIDVAIVAYWEGLAAGAQAAAKARYEETCRKARAMGVTYLEAPEVAALPIEQLLQRLERAETELAKLRTGTGPARVGTAPGPTAELTAAALLGGVSRATVPLSKLFDAYAKLKATSLESKTPKQRMKWSDVRRRAAANFQSVVGDKDLADLTHDDALAFREMWERRILSAGAKANTANTDFTYCAAMIKELNLHHKWRLQPLFTDLRFDENGDEDGQGVPFSTAWIRDRLLTPGALAGLPAEARRAVCLMIETGLRPRELVMLGPATIRLTGDTPYVHVQRSKNKNSRRDMPLVGVALAAMRLQPEGFPGYHDDPNKLSRHVNEYFTHVELRESPQTTLYSLRHSFKDRLRDVGTETELKDMLMGHSHGKENYGDGFTLRRKKEALDKIAFATYPSDL